MAGDTPATVVESDGQIYVAVVGGQGPPGAGGGGSSGPLGQLLRTAADVVVASGSGLTTWTDGGGDLDPADVTWSDDDVGWTFHSAGTYALTLAALVVAVNAGVGFTSVAVGVPTSYPTLDARERVRNVPVDVSQDGTVSITRQVEANDLWALDVTAQTTDNTDWRASSALAVLTRLA